MAGAEEITQKEREESAKRVKEAAAQAKPSESTTPATDGAGSVETTKVYNKDGKLVKKTLKVFTAPVPPAQVIVQQTAPPAPPPTSSLTPVPPAKKKGGGRIGIWGAVLLVLVGATIYAIASIVEHDQCLDCKDRIQYIPGGPTSVIDPSGTEIRTDTCCPPAAPKVEEKPKAQSDGPSTSSENLSAVTVRDGKRYVGKYLITDPTTALRCYDLVAGVPQRTCLSIAPFVGSYDEYELAAAMVARESGGNPDIIGPTGDHGILQITQVKAKDVYDFVAAKDKPNMLYRWGVKDAEDYLGKGAVGYSLQLLSVDAAHHLPLGNPLRGDVHAFLNLFRGKLSERSNQPSDYNIAVLENVKVIREARRKRGDYG